MSGIQKWEVTEPYLDIEGGLLEGPFYSAHDHTLRFVDIYEEKVYFVNLNEGPSSLRSVPTGVPVGVTVDVNASADGGKTDKVIVAAKHGYASLNTQTGELTWIHRVFDSPEKEYRMRFNDGAVDSHGRFWAGSCNDQKVHDFTPEGTMFRLDPDGSLHRMIEDMTIPNGIGWNKKNDTMYLTDSPLRTIFKWDYDAETGNISNRRVHFKLSEDDYGSGSVPDGFAIDEEDCIWTAVWGGSRVLRLNTAGQVIGEVSLPTRFITCPAFVGTELYITSAVDKDKENHPTSARYGGRLWRVDVGIKGKPKTNYYFAKES